MVTFSGLAEFYGTSFSAHAFFSDAKFNNRAYFIGSIFKNEADFTMVTFHGEAFFQDAKFRGEVVFKETIFNEEIDFRWVEIELGELSKCIFTKSVNLAGATIWGTLVFKHFIFAKTINLTGVQISKLVFHSIIFEDKAFFDSANIDEFEVYNSIFIDHSLFRKVAFAQNVIFENVYFIKSAYFSHRDDNGIFGGMLTMHSCDFQKPLRMEGANLKQASFFNTDLRDIRFVDCDWPKVPEGDAKGRKACYDEIILIRKRRKNKIIGSPPEAAKAIACGIKEENSEEVEAIYRQMKQKCKADHNESEASDWHFNEKEMRSLRKGLGDPLLYLYGLISGYAERPIRAGLVLLAFIAIFAVPLMIGLDKNYNESFLSIIQYVALDKNPDINLLSTKKNPIHVGWRYYKIIVQIIIYLQVTFFALAIRNRYRR
jgi:uncharacterized protein YjbI with pentapeptide repeats